MEKDLPAPPRVKKEKRIPVSRDILDLEKQNNVRFVYFGHEKEDTVTKTGVVCIAFYYNRGHIVYSVALCSPKDMFSKRKAKEIIRKRMWDLICVNSSGWTELITNTYTRPTRRQMMYMILHHIRFYAEPNRLGIKGPKPRWLDKLLDDADV